MFVELTRGRSFAGLARYCLHDEGRLPTTERVDFAVVRNLATEDPQVAWRLMVAKHYQQDRLKREAGVGPGGVQGAPVGHLVLSWKREEAEAEELDRSRMIRAAEGALRAIGASRREAIIVAHNDTDHPHLHVIVCLIKDDGRLKSNWKEREKLSKWALERERELHGEAVVKKREENWEARERGETPAPVKKKTRHLYELERAAEGDSVLAQFVEAHRRRLAALERRKLASARRREEERRGLMQRHLQRSRWKQRMLADRVSASRTLVRKAHRQRWRELLAEQEASRRLFQKNERTLRGRVANTFRSVNWRAVIGRSSGERAQDALSQAFRASRDESVRREGIKRKQRREKARLESLQRKQEAKARGEVVRKHPGIVRLGRLAFLRVERALKRRHAEELAEERSAQQRLTRERNEALRRSRERTFAARTSGELEQSRRAKKRADKPRLSLSRKERTNPIDVAGGKGAAEAARNMDEAKVVIKKRKRRERKPRKEREPRKGRRER